jgi:hypothetical protein
MSDPTKAEPRYDTGETAQEATDRMAGSDLKPMAKVPVTTEQPMEKIHPSAAAQPKPVGPDTHPSASHTYGSPIGQTVLRPRNGT